MELSGNLILNVENGSRTDERWQFDVKLINGKRVYGAHPSVSPRTKGTGSTNPNLPTTEEFLKQTPGEYKDYLNYWNKNYNPRIVGGRTTLRTGDYLEIFEENERFSKIWEGVLALATVKLQTIESETLFEYRTDSLPIGVDPTFWQYMFTNELFAVLHTDMGITMN